MQHTLNVQYTSPSGTVASVLTGTGDTNIEITNQVIAAGANNAETDLTIISAALQLFFIVATAAMTVVFKAGTGGSGTTGATFTLVANVPQFWVTGNGANPFGGNAGQMLVTSTAGGNLTIRALMQE